MSRLRKATLALLTTLLFMGALEAVLRAVTGPLGRASVPEQLIVAHVEKANLTPDPVLGWRVSDSGFLDRPVPPVSRPSGGWRAIAIGDSQTMGAGLKLENSWPKELEHLLAADAGRPVEVLNAAAPGYGSLQALRQVEEGLAAYTPDVWLIDCMVGDQPRDMRPRFPGLRRYLFHWRTYWVAHFAIDRLRGRSRSMHSDPEAGRPHGPPPHSQRPPPVLSDGAPDPALELQPTGNHDLIADAAAVHGAVAVFLTYPVWDQNSDRLICQAPADQLPEGVVIAHACEALQALDVAPKTLFFDANHMRRTATPVVAAAVRDALVEHGLQP